MRGGSLRPGLYIVRVRAGAGVVACFSVRVGGRSVGTGVVSYTYNAFDGLSVVLWLENKGDVPVFLPGGDVEVFVDGRRWLYGFGREYVVRPGERGEVSLSIPLSLVPYEDVGEGDV